MGVVVENNQGFGHFDAVAVRDERIETRPALGLVDSEHGVGIGCIGAKPVNRFGGKGTDAATAQNAGGGLEIDKQVNVRGIVHRARLTSPSPHVKKSLMPKRRPTL